MRNESAASYIHDIYIVILFSLSLRPTPTFRRCRCMEEGDKKGERGLTSFIPSLAIFSVLSALEAAEEAKRDPRVQERERVCGRECCLQRPNTHISLFPFTLLFKTAWNDDDWHGEESPRHLPCTTKTHFPPLFRKVDGEKEREACMLFQDSFSDMTHTGDRQKFCCQASQKKPRAIFITTGIGLFAPWTSYHSLFPEEASISLLSLSSYVRRIINNSVSSPQREGCCVLWHLGLPFL